MQLVVLSVIPLNQTRYLHSPSTQLNTVSAILVGASSSGLLLSTSLSGYGGKFVLEGPPVCPRFSFIQAVCHILHFISSLIYPLGAMELRIIKPSLKYTAGQWLFLQIPEISKFQWHPVRIVFTLPPASH